MPTERGFDPERARAIIAAHEPLEGACLPMLHALQEAFGYIDEAAVGLVAEALNRSRAEIHGVLTFYHDFRRAPEAILEIQLCRAEACQAQGSEALAAAAERLGIKLRKVYCLGNCALGPAARVGDDVVGRVDLAKLKALAAGVAPEAVAAGEAP